jgi:hypothetical protein
MTNFSLIQSLELVVCLIVAPTTHLGGFLSDVNGGPRNFHFCAILENRSTVCKLLISCGLMVDFAKQLLGAPY